MIELSVCIGSSCHLKGSYNVIQTFMQLIEEHSLHDKLDLKSTFCMKRCECAGVGLFIDGEAHHIQPETAKEFFSTVIIPKVL